VPRIEISKNGLLLRYHMKWVTNLVAKLSWKTMQN